MFTAKSTKCLILGYLATQIAIVLIQRAGSVWYNLVDDYYNLTNLDYDYYGSPIIDSPESEKIYYIYTVLTLRILTYSGYVPNIILYAVLVITTTLLIILFQRSNRRRNMLIARNKSDSSAKETKIHQAVIGVCVLYIVTAGPNNFFRTFMYLGVRFFIRGGLNVVIFYYAMHFVMVIHSLNHSMNIFVYLSLNPRFRKQFYKTFLLKKHLRV